MFTRTRLAVAVLLAVPAAVVAAPVVTVTADAPAGVASARPGGDHDERVCPKGYYWKVGHCARLPIGGPGRRAI